MTFIPPGRYRHYKGNEYSVVGVARHSETEEELVVYRQEYGDRSLWVRPKQLFLETVTVDGREVPRFQFVEAEGKENTMSTVTKEQIDSLLPFLDRFEAAGFSAGTWNNTLRKWPRFNFDEAVMKFQQGFYDNGWVTPSFDWTKWQTRAKDYIDSPEKIESADVETIQRLFITHIRKERFSEGHLAAMFENGHIVALLRRLKAIRGTMS